MYLQILQNMSPWQVYVFIFFIDFGIISGLMCFEELRGKPILARHKFHTFVINDIVMIPGLLTVRSHVVHHSHHMDDWYTQSWWYAVTLIIGVAISLGLEADAVRKGDFTMSQELSPSKLFHTIIFGPIFCLCLTTLPVVLFNRPFWWTLPLAALFVAGWVRVMMIDGQLGHRQNAHCNWSWRTLRPTWLDDQTIDILKFKG